MKKLLSILLAVTLIISICPLGLFSITASAADMTAAEIQNQIATIYQKSLNSRGSSFSGYCGAYTGWQLYHMGINSSYEAYNGNVTFDNYNNKTHSSGGYTITSYPSSRYTLKSALNELSAYGTRNVYNILVGLEKGNTAASSTAGHAMVIHAIINGIVYFSESSGLTIRGTYYPEGSAIACDINYFCDYILMWAGSGYTPVFDGVIHFTKDSQPEVTKITASGVNYPINKQSGQPFQVFGTIASPNDLVWVQCYVMDTTGKMIFWGGYGFTDAEKAQKIKVYNVNYLDSLMTFAGLAAGNYTYYVEALDNKGYYVGVINDFTVTSSNTTSGTATKVGVHDHTQNSNYTWGSWVTSKPATCTTAGTKTRTCYCGEVQTTQIPQKGHTFNKEVVEDKYLKTSANCTAAAEYYKSCECGQIGTSTFSYGVASDHFLITMSEIPPRCDSDGRSEITACMFCSYQTGGDPIPATEHSYSCKKTSIEYKATDADCTHPATYYYSCACGKKGTTTFDDINAFGGGFLGLGHTYDNSYDTSCNVCGYIRSVSGDIDGNGSIDAADLALLKKVIAKIVALDDASVKNPNVDNEAGEPNAADLAQLKKIIAKLV